jgi:23S rRNA (cytidine1920-2'-O)/16S rRNA (cytidine1409-2'-O)-methyltransferase
VGRRRLDAELVRRGLASSRTRAVEAIEAGRVTVAGSVAANPARQVAADEPLGLAPAARAYVSRGGHKLAGALDAFGVAVAGRRCLDAGASTGGFTDCLLQRGAVHVVAVDVGRGQIAWQLRQDPRVELRERTNVRFMESGDVEPRPDLVVGDLSFISLGTVAPALAAVAAPAAEFVLLVKPQFEAGPAQVGKRGVVKDPAVHRSVLGKVVDDLAAASLGVDAVAVSSPRGADGNVEFFVHARRGALRVADDELDAVVARAHEPAAS